MYNNALWSLSANCKVIFSLSDLLRVQMDIDILPLLQSQGHMIIF